MVFSKSLDLKADHFFINHSILQTILQTMGPLSIISEFPEWLNLPGLIQDVSGPSAARVPARFTADFGLAVSSPPIQFSKNQIKEYPLF